MRKIVFRVLSLALILSLFASLIGCSNEVSQKGLRIRKYKDNAFSDDITSSGVVCENDRWQLIWDNSKKQVNFKDKSTDYVWGQIPTEALAEDKYSKTNNLFKSAIAVSYYDYAHLAENTAYAFQGAVRDGGVYATAIENGLSVTYDFLEMSMSVTVDYLINEDSFSVEVDPKKITDDGSNIVTGVAVLPFTCGIENGSDTDWIFIPDGTGSILKPANTNDMGDSGEIKIYGEDLSVQKYFLESIEKQANMPVFGTVKGDKGLFGIVTSGTEQASLEYLMGSASIGFSSVYPSYRIKGYSLVETPDGFGWTNQKQIKIFDKYANVTKLHVDYYALSGEKASLSGFADIYRDYLTKTYKMEKSDLSQKTADLKLVGGVIKDSFFLGLPSTEFVPLTTVDQTEKIISELTKEIGDDLSVKLVGYGKSGITAGEIGGGFKVSGKLGGTKKLSKLLKSLDKTGTDVAVDFDVITLAESGAGYSFNSDSAILPNGGDALISSFNFVNRKKVEERIKILSRTLLRGVSSDIISAKEDFGFKNVSLSSLSKIIYSDCANPNYRIADKMKIDVPSIFASIKKAKVNVISSAANDYAAAASDAITDCPINCSEYSFAYTRVPFYQMVFKGIKPLSSESVNLSTDETEALLFCAESGMTPSFTLISNYDKDLATADVPVIYGSVYSGMKNKLISAVTENADFFESVKSAGIKNIKILSNNLHITYFDNGVCVAVNYGDTDAATDYGTVPAKGLLTGRGW